jgi:hypothetical protein
VSTIWKWVKRAIVGIYAAIAGVFGSGGRVIVDRRDMYGDDPKNDPYSIEYDPSTKRP